MHKKRIFFRSVQKYYYHVQKNCLFLGPCRNITIQGHQGQGVPGVPCRAIFSGREEILIFGEIFTSADSITCGTTGSGLDACSPKSKIQMRSLELKCRELSNSRLCCHNNTVVALCLPSGCSNFAAEAS